MRRWVASVLLLALFALAGVPGRAFPLLGADAQPSTASGPTQREAGLCTQERAGQVRVAPPVLRSELGTLSELTLIGLANPRSARWDQRQLPPWKWLGDQRESIRRVCRRFAPPEAPAASRVA